jgi:hypothetical protein
MLCDTHPFLAETLYQALCTLKCVRICTIADMSDPFDNPKSLKDRGYLSMGDIQRFTARWPNLRALSIYKWGKKDLVP